MTTAPLSPRAYLQPLIAVVLIVAALYLAKPIIVPLALAVLLTFVLTPVVTSIQGYGLRRVPAVLLTVFLTFVLVGLVGWIVVVQVHNFARDLPDQRDKIDAKIAGLRGAGAGPFADALQMIREIAKGETRAEAAAERKAPKEQIVIAQPREVSNFEQLANAAGTVLEPLAQAGLVVVLVIFMLIQREDLRNRVIGLLGHGRLTGTTRVLVDAAQRLSRFLLTQLLINVGFGILFATALFFIGVQYAPLWGFLAVVLRFVPYIGSLVAVALPLVVAFAVAPGWTQPILVVVLFAGLELITANFIEPTLFGHGTGVAPVALLVAAAFWTWIWGPVGLVLSTPLTVCLVVLGQHVPRFRFFMLLLGDQPPLAPHVSYYQRLLSRDRAEAEQVVADHARANGQESVYDDVLLPALALARRDRRHAGLSAEDEAFIFQATKDILCDIAHRAAASSEAPADADGRPVVPGETPAAPSPGVLILGCPAHHEAEELAVSMLAQLLKGDGFAVEGVSVKALPAEVETRAGEENPALVFVAVIPPGGVVQARFRCKRLRKRFAKLPIIVGYWGDERNYNAVLARLHSAGASYVTTSLAQSRSQIRALITQAQNAAGPAAPRGIPSGEPAAGTLAGGGEREEQ